MSSAELTGLVWDRLRNEAARETLELGIPSVALDVVTDAGPARLALGDGGEARFLLPIRPGAPFPSIRDGHGLQLRDMQLTVGQDPVRFIDLTGPGEQLEEVFRRVISEIVRRLTAGEIPARAVEGAIQDFRALLRAQSGDVSIDAAIGLLGELLVLNRLLRLDAGAWRSWSGPDGARHDFRAGSIAVEVKATLRSPGRTFTVSSPDQLLEPPGGNLFLFWMSFEDDPGGTLSVPDVAADALATADDPEGLTAQLLKVGFDPDAHARWRAWRFSPLFSEGYAVVPGFPRLVPADFGREGLPPGISHFRYDVDLAAAAAFRLTEDDAQSALGRMVKCL